MIRSLLVALLIGLIACVMTAAPSVAADATDAATATAPLATLDKNGVHVVIRLEPGATAGTATLAATFAPTGAGFHLYGIDLAAGSPYTPPRIEAEAPLTALAPVTADIAAIPGPKDDSFGVLPIYTRPVTLRLAIRLPAGAADAQIPAAVRISYQTCDDHTCLQPARRVLVPFSLPGAGTDDAPTNNAAAASASIATTTAPAIDAAALQSLVQSTVHDELARHDALRDEALDTKAIHWLHPSTAKEAEAMIASAQAEKKAAFLDFTGPSCINCQAMAKSVLRLGVVVKGWNTGSPIAIDTDASDDLADWQQARFHTQTRPLYVRIAPDGTETRWSEFFSPTDTATLTKFTGFLHGSAGSDAGTGSGATFWILAIIGGLITLLMPCTYPMVPFTITFFTKQGAAGKAVLPLALVYSLGIVGSFVGLGVLITGIFHKNLGNVAGSPWINLVFGALFIILGLSLIGVFLLRLPFGLENRFGGAKSGYVGALFMGLTYALTAFSCAVPFAGTVLAEAVATGTWTRAIAGMAVYSATIAIPFFLLALSPNLLRALPRSSAWLGEFKVIGGLVEIAAAFKFLAITDNAWGIGLVTRATSLSAWAALALVASAYLLGKIRLPGDPPLTETGPTRLLLAGIFLTVAFWITAGLFGANLGVLESFFPADAAP
jgi:thiol:disulfide interchange protein